MVISEKVCKAVIAAATRVSNQAAKRSSERAFELLCLAEMEREWNTPGEERMWLGPNTVDPNTLCLEQLTPEAYEGQGELGRVDLYRWVQGRDGWWTAADAWEEFGTRYMSRQMMGSQIRSLCTRGLLLRRQGRGEPEFTKNEVEDAEERLFATAAISDRSVVHRKARPREYT